MESNKLTHQIAAELLHSNMMNINLRRHCYAVSVAMRGLHSYLKSKGNTDSSVENLSEEDWGVVGLLHDADYEVTKEDTTKHTLVLLDWLKIYDAHTHIVEAFKSHNTKITHLREPETLLEWSLECCDELTGFIVACSLVRSDKKLSSVDVDSVKKKWKAKEFARNVDRRRIEQCTEKLGITLDVFIEVVLKAMRSESDKLGL